MSRSKVVWHVPPEPPVMKPPHRKLDHRDAEKHAYGVLPGKHYQPNGGREVERRRRQMERKAQKELKL
ncbi:hypothetical protein ABIB86_000460 [Bradyrhizobium sp. JR1.7]|uniref:hypothetical protein n=1 Tax=unclassified Bradyrhizobium TaxID=2631580 RepID=UPI00339239C7